MLRFMIPRCAHCEGGALMSALPVLAVTAPHAALMLHAHIVRHAAMRLAVPVLRVIGNALSMVLPARLVSVITPTWQRFTLLTRRCVPSVREQSYTGTVEHLIISDGPDEKLNGIPGVSFLAEHLPAPNRGVNARRHGADLARGELVAYLDDDNAWWFNHLELLTRALDESGADFAYSQALCTEPHGYRWTIGAEPPAYSQIDTSMIVHRRELLDVANWEPSDGPADWGLVSRWLDAGARWVHVPAVTVDYYARTMPLTALGHGYP